MTKKQPSSGEEAKPSPGPSEEARRIAAKLLAMRPKIHDDMKIGATKRTTGKGRAPVGKSKA